MNERNEISENSDDWIEQIIKNSSGKNTTEESLRRKIQRSPQNGELWRDEIQAVIAGKRTSQIQKLDGAISSYFRLIIDGSRDPFAARSAFSCALNHIVQEWQPSVIEDEERLYTILSLVSSFTPPAGFVKIAGFLKTANWFRRKFTDPLRPKKNIDLHLLALVALSNFFPVPPLNADTDLAFQTYLSILESNLLFTDYFGFCAGKFVALGAKRIDAPDVLKGIEENPVAMSEILAALFDSGNQSATEKNLSRLFSYCRSKNLEKYFSAAVHQLGGEFDKKPQVHIYDDVRTDKYRLYPSPIILRKKRRFEIAITPDQIPSYIRERDIETVPSNLRGWLREPKVMSEQIKEEMENIFIQARDESSIDKILRELRKLGGNFKLDRTGQDSLIFSLDQAEISVELPTPRLEQVQKRWMLSSLEPENKAPVVEKLKHFAQIGGS